MVIVISPASRGNQLNEPCCYPPAALQYTKSKLNQNSNQKSCCCFVLKSSEVRKKCGKIPARPPIFCWSELIREIREKSCRVGFMSKTINSYKEKSKNLQGNFKFISVTALFSFHFYFLDKYGVSGRPYQSS